MIPAVLPTAPMPQMFQACSPMAAYQLQPHASTRAGASSACSPFAAALAFDDNSETEFSLQRSQSELLSSLRRSEQEKIQLMKDNETEARMQMRAKWRMAFAMAEQFANQTK